MLRRAKREKNEIINRLYINLDVFRTVHDRPQMTAPHLVNLIPMSISLCACHVVLDESAHELFTMGLLHHILMRACSHSTSFEGNVQCFLPACLQRGEEFDSGSDRGTVWESIKHRRGTRVRRLYVGVWAAFLYLSCRKIRWLCWPRDTCVSNDCRGQYQFLSLW